MVIEMMWVSDSNLLFAESCYGEAVGKECVSALRSKGTQVEESRQQLGSEVKEVVNGRAQAFCGL